MKAAMTLQMPPEGFDALSRFAALASMATGERELGGGAVVTLALAAAMQWAETDPETARRAIARAWTDGQDSRPSPG